MSYKSSSIDQSIAALEHELAGCQAKLAEEQESHRQNLGQCNEHVKTLEARCERMKKQLDFSLSFCPPAVRETVEQALTGKELKT